jgi:hypothetical protein
VGLRGFASEGSLQDDHGAVVVLSAGAGVIVRELE